MNIWRLDPTFSPIKTASFCRRYDRSGHKGPKVDLMNILIANLSRQCVQNKSLINVKQIRASKRDSRWLRGVHTLCYFSMRCFYWSFVFVFYFFWNWSFLRAITPIQFLYRKKVIDDFRSILFTKCLLASVMAKTPPKSVLILPGFFSFVSLLGFFVQLEKFFLIWRRHNYTWKNTDFYLFYVYNGHFRGPVTLTPIAKRLIVE